MTTATTRRRANSTPPNTCGGCDATWTALGAAHCADCHRTLSSVTLFDRHRTNAGEHGRCYDPSVLVGRSGAPLCEFRDGMWRFPAMDDDAKAARFGDAA